MCAMPDLSQTGFEGPGDARTSTAPAPPTPEGPTPTGPAADPPTHDLGMSARAAQLRQGVADWVAELEEPGERRLTLRRRIIRLLAFTTAFVGAGYLGRLTIIDGGSLSLVWPAAGVAAVWIGTARARTLATDLLAIGAATLLINMTTGATLSLGLVFVITNLTQAVVFVGLARLWIPNTWGLGVTGSAPPLHHLMDLGKLIMAAASACAVGATLGNLGVAAITGSTSAAGVVVWWGRNWVAVVVLTVLGILIGQRITAHADAGDLRAWLLRTFTPDSAIRMLEGIGLVVASATLYLALFFGQGGQALAFLLLSTTVWAGLRFEPVAVVVHGIALGGIGVFFTLQGHGPFALIGSVSYQAIVSQVFIAMTVLTGLALSFSRFERDAALHDLSSAERQAAERATMLTAVVESMREGLIVVEDGGRIVLRNEASRTLLGLRGPHDRVRSASDYHLYRSNGEPVTDSQLPGVRALRGEDVAPEDYQLRCDTVPGGRVLEIASHRLPSAGPGVPDRALVNIRDVTLDRQHRDTLVSFAGVIAHDLFNPLSVIDGWAEALEDELGHGPLEAPVARPMLMRLRRASEHMRSFIGDLMTYTVARDHSLQVGPVDLTALTRELASLRTQRGNDAKITVAEGLKVWADPALVGQLIDNLLGNAVKYVRPEVRPVVNITGHAQDGWLEVSVADNGIGIPENQREEIFETFHRAHREGYQGTGLGLSICRRIVERHGGTIRVEPGRQGGSIFIFRLPVRAARVNGARVPAQSAS